MADIADRTQDFGANSWLVEEMYEQFRNDPASVSDAWREFFSDYKSMLGNGSSNGAAVTPAPSAAPVPAAPAPTTAASAAPAPA
ncbi:MAG: multifunctional 2-oxoglutarate metabolism enzyme, partial [Actinomycetota bacterium]